MKSNSVNRISFNYASLLIQLMLITIALLSSLMLTNCGGSGGGSAGSSAAFETGDTGVAGSMSRFAIVGNYLYAIAGPDIQLFDITDPSDPILWSNVRIDFDIETLFPYGDYLFIGS